MKAIYAGAAEDYWNCGWQPVPLPVREKKNPPAGVTGKKGRDVTEQDVADWKIQHPPLSNIGIRLPQNVVGIDVDDYLSDSGQRKVGGRTLGELEADLGPLPPTAVSSSRFQHFPESGIRLYRVPDGYDTATWPTRAGQDIDLIRHGHRYAVVAPSTVKGRRYEWMDQRTGEVGETPCVADLPLLPVTWCDYLTPSQKAPSSPSGASVQASHPYVRAALRNAWDELCKARDGERNDVLNHKSYSLGRLVGGTELTEDEVRETLTDACRENGYLDDEGQGAVDATITSGLAAGQEKPKGVPEQVGVDEAAILADALGVSQVKQGDSVGQSAYDAAQERENAKALQLLRARRWAEAEIAKEDLESVQGDRAKQTLRTYVKKDPPKPIIENILGVEMNLLGGPTQAGKSLLARDWSIAVASGEPWHGHAVPEQRNVLWIASEGTHDMEHRWSSQPHYENAVDHIYVLEDPVNLVRGNDVDWLLEEYADERPGLVVFDVVYGMGMADDNGTKDVLPVINSLKRISREWDAATLALGHTGHDSSQRRFRGASSWRQLAITEWHMSDGMLDCMGKNKIDDASNHSYPYLLAYPHINYLSLSAVATLASDRDKIIEADITAHPNTPDRERARRLHRQLGLGEDRARKLIAEVRRTR